MYRKNRRFTGPVAAFARLRRLGCGITFGATIAMIGMPAYAGPWAEVGNEQLRSNIGLLSAAGVVDSVVTQWPLPWGIGLSAPKLPSGSYDYIGVAASNVIQSRDLETATGQVRAGLSIDLATEPALVRGFDALGRQKAQGTISLEYLTDTTGIHLNVGARSASGSDRRVLTLEGTYITQRIDEFAVYAGYVDHWWGPGWFSALGLSNNATPMPQIGITRLSSAPLEIPILKWLGPWRAEFLAGVLDGPRVARDTAYIATRFTFNPIAHLEIGLSRTTEMCGSGHRCSPSDYFALSNDSVGTNQTNDEVVFDVRYSRAFSRWSYELYGQAMNEDTGPFLHSGTSHLVGASVWLPFRAGLGRFTTEYTDSIATTNLFGGGIFNGVAYNNAGYPDGMRYRGRTLGFSLDSDSRLFSLEASFSDRRSRSISLTYHNARINSAENLQGNVVSPVPVTINLVEARTRLPIWIGGEAAHLDITGRIQDKRLPPDSGALPSVEVALSAQL